MCNVCVMCVFVFFVVCVKGGWGRCRVSVLPGQPLGPHLTPHGRRGPGELSLFLSSCQLLVCNCDCLAQDQLKGLLIASGFPEGVRHRYFLAHTCSYSVLPPPLSLTLSLTHSHTLTECFVPYNLRVTGPDERTDMVHI